MAANAAEPIPSCIICNSGAPLGPVPTPLFNGGWYAGQYLAGASGVDKDPYSPFEHYMMIGRKQGYSPSRHFDEAAYRSDYPEVDEQVIGGSSLEWIRTLCLRGHSERLCRA